MAIEIVDFPIKHGDFPVRYVKLPEGNRSEHSNVTLEICTLRASAESEEEEIWGRSKQRPTTSQDLTQLEREYPSG